MLISGLGLAAFLSVILKGPRATIEHVRSMNRRLAQSPRTAPLSDIVNVSFLTILRAQLIQSVLSPISLGPFDTRPSCRWGLKYFYLLPSWVCLRTLWTLKPELVSFAKRHFADFVYLAICFGLIPLRIPCLL